ncbi:MAG: nitrous oxide reductase accessory protein NosL [Melioribacteraceae bacterium]
MKAQIINIISIFSLLLVLVACKVEPEEIKYGKDKCLHCDMMVVSKTHSAQYVTKKGKAFMFDSAECLVWEIDEEKNEDKLEFLLVTDYANPGKLIDARKATFLISEKIKSPMGANLSSFSSKETAEKFLDENGGKLFSWEQLKVKLAK